MCLIKCVRTRSRPYFVSKKIFSLKILHRQHSQSVSEGAEGFVPLGLRIVIPQVDNPAMPFCDPTTALQVRCPGSTCQQRKPPVNSRRLFEYAEDQVEQRIEYLASADIHLISSMNEDAGVRAFNPDHSIRPRGNNVLNGS